LEAESEEATCQWVFNGFRSGPGNSHKLADEERDRKADNDPAPENPKEHRHAQPPHGFIALLKQLRTHLVPPGLYESRNSLL
jgi:hypothetical protein